MREWTVELIVTPAGRQAWLLRDGLQQAYVRPALNESGESIAWGMADALNAAERAQETSSDWRQDRRVVVTLAGLQGVEITEAEADAIIELVKARVRVPSGHGR